MTNKEGEIYNPLVDDRGYDEMVLFQENSVRFIFFCLLSSFTD